jgi:arabinose-5-phosphate isomerase
MNMTDFSVQDVMLDLGRFPVSSPSALLKESLESMGVFGLGIVCLIDDQNVLHGIITDGDIRRQLLVIQKPFAAFFADDSIDHATTAYVSVMPDQSLRDAVDLMELKHIWDLPVVKNSKLVGLLHLHPAVKALLV